MTKEEVVKSWQDEIARMREKANYLEKCLSLICFNDSITASRTNEKMWELYSRSGE